ncbi:hypothetical protein [Candidatus Velamenicoccus archaeovorus]|uniref:hypothetical protein n=1 Tax=Velamenicoccus archaeovorus TaxID=1930593 RepID=UPI000FFE4F53|nr:hypothetical protein [Candidatus Velamenicoccus archaeovorus]
MDFARIIAIIALIVIFLVVLKYAVRVGCLFFLIALVALITYLWTTGIIRRFDFFRKKDGHKTVVSLAVSGEVNGGCRCGC